MTAADRDGLEERTNSSQAPSEAHHQSFHHVKGSQQEVCLQNIPEELYFSMAELLTQDEKSGTANTTESEIDQGTSVVHSSMVVDNRAVAMLADSPAWGDIVNACGCRYVAPYDKGDPKRPLKWLENRESLAALCLSLSSEPVTETEMRAIASAIQRDHSFNDPACTTFAQSEAKWLLRALTLGGRTLLAALMALPDEIKAEPGPPAPLGHSAAGNSMRVAMVHAAFVTLAISRRVMQDKNVGDSEGFTVLPLDVDTSSDA